MNRLTQFLIFAVTSIVFNQACLAADPPDTVRVLTYNIHHGEGADGAIDLKRIAEVIKQARPDLVALQEVDRGVERTHRMDMPAEFAKLTGMRAIFEKNIDYQGGEYGNAVLCSLPIESFTNHKLPQSLPNEQRGMLEVHVNVGQKKLLFFATHLDYHPEDGERMESVAMLKKLVGKDAETPIIVAGDLNAQPQSRVIQEATTFLSDSFGVAKGDDCFTFPADQPKRRIDYVLFNDKDQLRCVEHRVLPESVASDHRPLLAVFELER